jgi:two-component sensor histidine kinase
VAAEDHRAVVVERAAVAAHEDEVVVMWTERGGPPVTAPSVPEGFGSKLVHRTVAAQLGGAIAFDWSPEGVVVTLRMSKGRLAY